MAEDNTSEKTSAEQKPFEKSSPTNQQDSKSDAISLDSSPSKAADTEKAEAAAPATNPWADPSQFPDGGPKAWLTVGGAAACLFCSFGWINCVGIFQDYYTTHQLSGYTSSEIAWIPALQVFFMLSLGPFLGKIFDDFGPSLLLALGTFLHVLGLMMVSISERYYSILLSQAICSAIGASMIFYPAVNCTSTWFFQKRGQAIGIVAAGSSLGGVIFPIMITHLLPEVGFGWTLRITAFLILALLIFANLTVRSRIPPSRRPFQISSFVKPLGEPAYALLGIAVFFFYWGMFIPFTFIVVEAQTKGMSYRLANYLVPILNAASIFGRTLPNVIADKYAGRFNTMIVMAFFSCILVLALWLPASGNAALIIFAALFGISSGAGIGLAPALVAQISPIKDIGVRTGTIFAIASIAALTGSPIAGQIVTTSNGSFTYCAVFSGVSLFVGACLFTVTRIKIAGVKMAKI